MLIYKQISKAKTTTGNYQVVAVSYSNDPKEIKYYQVQKNRKAITNFNSNIKNNKIRAIQRMLKEANYDLLNLFEV